MIPVLYSKIVLKNVRSLHSIYVCAIDEHHSYPPWERWRLIVGGILTFFEGSARAAEESRACRASSSEGVLIDGRTLISFWVDSSRHSCFTITPQDSGHMGLKYVSGPKWSSSRQHLTEKYNRYIHVFRSRFGDENRNFLANFYHLKNTRNLPPMFTPYIHVGSSSQK